MKRYLGLGVLAVFILVGLFPLYSPDPATTNIAIDTLLFAVTAVGWNIFGGYTGYFSLGYGTYYGFGAYTLALIYQKFPLPGDYVPFLFVPVAGLVAALVAIPIGWLSLRTRQAVFMVVTLATLFIFQLVASNVPAITNGASGLALPTPSWHGDFFNIPFFYASFILLILTIAVSWWIRRSKFGLGLLAIRDDEDRALSLGVKTSTYKLVAFVISGFFGGTAGAMFAYLAGLVGPASAFNPGINSIPAVMAFLGGVGTLSGPILGAFLLIPLQQQMDLQISSLNISFLNLNAQGLDFIVDGLLLLLVIVFLPEGIVPSLSRWWRNRQEARATARPLIAANDVEETVAVESRSGGKA